MVSPPSAVRWRGSTSCAADLVAVLGDGLVLAPKRANAWGAGDAPGGFSRSQPRFSAPVGTRRRRRRSTVRFPSRSSFPPGWRQAREHGHVWGCFQARGRGAPRAHRQLQQETPALGGTPQHPQLGYHHSGSLPATFWQLPAACHQPRAPPARPRHTEGGRDTSASGVLAASPPPPPGSSPGERCPRYSCLQQQGTRCPTLLWDSLPACLGAVGTQIVPRFWARQLRGITQLPQGESRALWPGLSHREMPE